MPPSRTTPPPKTATFYGYNGFIKDSVGSYRSWRQPRTFADAQVQTDDLVEEQLGSLTALPADSAPDTLMDTFTPSSDDLDPSSLYQEESTPSSRLSTADPEVPASAERSARFNLTP